MVNFEIADFASRLNVATRAHLISVKVRPSLVSLRLLDILYIND